MKWTATIAICTCLIQSGNAVAAHLFTLHSGGTEITVAAGAQSPRLIQFRLKNGDVWKQDPSEVTIDPLLQQVIQQGIDHVGISGGSQPLRWKWVESLSSHDQTHLRLVYDSDFPRLRLDWEWSVRSAPGPIEHTIRIRNLSGKTLWIPLQASAAFAWRVPADEPLEELWVEKGAGGPSAEGTHRIAMGDGYKWTGTSSTYAHPAPGKQREMIPYVLVDRPGPDGSGWYMGIEFSGRTRIVLERKGAVVSVEAGLNPGSQGYRTRLEPGETFEAPPIFLGAFRGGPDAAGNILRRWVRGALNNPRTIRNPDYPLLVNNSWGSGMAIDDAQARTMIRDSAELGFEMFHLDAGWFRTVGDWRPDPQKFPHGLAPIADYAHSLGLKFGLWMDWAQAGSDPKAGFLYARNPQIHDWLTVDPPADWKPQDDFKGVTMDIGASAVRNWASAELDRVVTGYHLDMLEHDGYVVAQGCDRRDHPHAPPDPAFTRRFEDSGFPWVESSNSTDVSYHATRSYYEIYSNLRRRHPGLLLEICNDGGRMVDFGSAAHGDYFSISDAYDPLSNRRAFYDSSYVLPPAMLEAYVEKWPAPKKENFLYVLRSGMMGWFTLMLDTTAWTAQQHDTARNAIELYKSRLRPLIRHADLYHVSLRPDGVHWDGMEYCDATEHAGVLFAFHGSSAEERHHRFVLQGLQADARYRLVFEDKSAPERVATGAELMGDGVDVHLPVAESSELVFFNKVR